MTDLRDQLHTVPRVNPGQRLVRDEFGNQRKRMAPYTWVSVCGVRGPPKRRSVGAAFSITHVLLGNKDTRSLSCRRGLEWNGGETEGRSIYYPESWLRLGELFSIRKVENTPFLHFYLVEILKSILLPWLLVDFLVQIVVWCEENMILHVFTFFFLFFFTKKPKK